MPMVVSVIMSMSVVIAAPSPGRAGSHAVAHRPGGCADRDHDVLVARAATEVALDRVADLVVRRLGRPGEQIRGGQRQNADPEMVAQIAKFEEREMRAVLDYVSRLKPPEELQASPGWNNPDF